ncbi:MAG: PfkB family carbohydrate kinase [Candidatus Cloacimonetes bacterium]|nr:PfkB family carbohydrate kinase [Candidatus Cloacimonadota bacterium]
MKDKKMMISELLNTQTVPFHLIVGFDGFIDEIIHVVDKRIDNENFQRIKTISDFAGRIANAAGLSANIELSTVRQKLGGNGPIMAKSLLAQGYKVSYMGALGCKEIHPVFRDFSVLCSKVISLADPGHTDALEFNDGKVMLGKLSDLRKVNWLNLLQTFGEENLVDLLKKTELIAFTNWTMLPEMNSLLLGFSQLLKELKLRPKAYIDLADPTKRRREDIKEVLQILTKLQNNAQVALGLNQNESSIIADILNIFAEDLRERATLIRNELNLDRVVIHPVQGAAAATVENSFWVDGPYCQNPKLITGAGDNFNAGFCSGWLRGLDLESCLICGVATSGFYVRNEYSPTQSELKVFLDDWQKGNLD